ncbi:MAG: hypothetical protein Q4F69_05960, partial [Bacteroidia bacterium]|nr:hypothetical protein [Bacteroidia bacterium]
KRLRRERACDEFNHKNHNARQRALVVESWKIKNQKGVMKMRKFGLIISALALVLGLAQCAKKPNMPIMGNYQMRSITFSTGGNGGQKGTFEDVANALNYKWNGNEKIHVYVTTGDDNDFSYGMYCGTLEFAGFGDDNTEAIFENREIPIPEDATKIRFVHCGENVNVSVEGSTDEVDFSNQDGDLSTVSNKVIALCDKSIDPKGIYKNCWLEVQFAVLKLKFTDFAEEDVFVKGMGSDGLKLEKTGKIAYNPAASNAKLTSPSDDFYAVFMPAGNSSYTFGNTGVTATMDGTIEANKFYTQEIKATHIASPAVTTYFGCIGDGIFNYGGEVDPGEPQTCEYGIVYSTENSTPTIGGADCTQESVATVSLSSPTNFSVDVANWDESKTTYVRAYAIGCDLVPRYGSVSVIDDNGVVKDLPELWTNGENPHPFTVASGNKVVHFSQGNLQWTAAGTHAADNGERLGTWRFAKHQFDIIGDENKNISDTYTDGWIDLFGWATSGYYPSTLEDRRQPYRWDDDNETYGNGEYDLDHNLDWGTYNDISNDGGYGVSAWRTLSKDEWCYMIKPLYFYDGEWKPYTGGSRANAENLRGFATIGGCTHGVVVLPDDWSGDLINTSFSGWDNNKFTHPEWREMEEKGAVFLPAAGARDEKEPSGVNIWGCYWSGTHYKTVSAIYFDFSTIKNEELGDFKAYVGYYERFRGRSVRVVRDVTSK